MTTALEQKKEIFKRRVQAVETMDALKKATRFFSYKLVTNQTGKDREFHTRTLADEASYLFDIEIGEFDMMYVVESVCDFFPDIISHFRREDIKLYDGNYKGYSVIVRAGKLLYPAQAKVIMDEITRHYKPGGLFDPGAA
jgi:hypothetical protein